MKHHLLHPWAGGKGRIIDVLLSHMLPDPARHGRAVVPFWGSGVDGRAFAQAGLDVIGGDTCAPLVAAHRETQLDPQEIFEQMSKLQPLDCKEFFYSVRSGETTLPTAGIRFLYLVGTSFNGLYRTNSKGKFNAPYGRIRKRADGTEYQIPLVVNKDSIFGVAEQMRRVNLLTRPWLATLGAAQTGDLVYCDPPYLSNFVGYHGDGFSDGETQSLFAECRRLAAKGCDVWMSNADTDRIRELAAIYSAATLISVDARRSIAANGGKRGVVRELLIHF